MKTTSTCLITGGAGFIGSHLSEALLNKGFKVLCVDNLVTGSIRNIEVLLKNPSFHFLKHDVTAPFPAKFESELSDLSYVFHLASAASPPAYRRLALETLLVNSVGTTKMLELATKLNAVFLLASTSEVYGDPLEHPQKETYFGNVNPVGLRACYDEAKRYAEAVTIEYFRKYKTHVRIARIFNTYGPNMQKDDGRVISNMVNQALEGKALTIYGEGDQTRSFCFISDMVEALIKMSQTKNLDGEVINVGNTNEQTVSEIANLIKSLVGGNLEIIKLPQRLGDDPQRRRPDITKAKKLLEWEPTITIKEGLLQTIQYFKSV